MQKNEKFSFEIICRTPCGARRGRIVTPHGTVETPAFIFCGTKGAVKGASAEQLRACGTQIALANTYHLHLQPGEDTVAALGGLHAMMGWSGPLLTDSGGFQIFSLGHGGVAQEIKSRRAIGAPRTLMAIDEDGALFRSYVDGSLRKLTPENSIAIQRSLGADIVLPLDECTPYHVDKKYTAASMARSHRWELRSLAEFKKFNCGAQAIYGIIQGGVYGDLRKESCEFVGEEDFFGQAIGGSLGGSGKEMEDVVALVCAFKHRTKPTHLLGIGSVDYIFHGVRNGIDSFDCVHPTRLGRHGGALMANSISDGKGHINLRNSRFARDRSPIDDSCDCHTCKTTSRGYLHHLLKAKETLAGQLLTIHNITFMNRLMERIRHAIESNTLPTVESYYIG
ncbi:MAG: tRNA guanosine(34) transglycosylase Tgt [Puniceicoccales bacterium]|nr:tRNA guanosine(34) transglycosylase Tgt [Puniceicoccales bacterium]